MTHSAVLTAFLILSFTVHPALAEAKEGCPFLSDAEVEKIAGRELLFKLKSMPLPDGGGALCDSNIVRVIVFSGKNSENRWENMIKGYGRAQEKRIPLKGLGEKAYALHLEPRSENEYPTTLIVVTSDSYTAAVSVRANDGEAANTAQTQATVLAKIVISRIK